MFRLLVVLWVQLACGIRIQNFHDLRDCEGHVWHIHIPHYWGCFEFVNFAQLQCVLSIHTDKFEYLPDTQVRCGMCTELGPEIELAGSDPLLQDVKYFLNRSHSMWSVAKSSGLSLKFVPALEVCTPGGIRTGGADWYKRHVLDTFWPCVRMLDFIFPQTDDGSRLLFCGDQAKVWNPYFWERPTSLERHVL